MGRASAPTAALLLGLLLLCPLASAGIFAPCHDGEPAMDCCLPHEGSRQQPASGAKLAAAVATLVAVAALPAVPAAALVSLPAPEATRSRSGPRQHSLLSVFLI